VSDNLTLANVNSSVTMLMNILYEAAIPRYFFHVIWCTYMVYIYEPCSHCLLCFVFYCFFIFFSCLAYLTASKVWLCCYVDDASMNAVLFQYKMDLFYQALVSLLSDFCYILPLPL